jgi:RNA polymerase sigma-70 factor, ECF subfamily
MTETGVSLSTSARFHGDNRFCARAPGDWGRLMLTQAELVWLLAAVAKGDDAAFARLYEATRAKLYGVLLRILGRPELAEDVMQETYLKVWKTAGSFDPTLGSPITWMVAIARNRAIDIVRKKSETSIEVGAEALSIAADTPAPLARREMTEELKRLLSCLGKLDPEKQRILLLAYYSGWSRDQLSKKLDIPVNTIKTWLRRSLLEIRECMSAS